MSFSPRRVRGLVMAGALAASILTGCASSGAVPQPFPIPGGGPPVPTPPPSAPAEPAPPMPGSTVPERPRRGEGLDGYALSSTALALRGAPYRAGGSSPAGFDCSGFVQYVFGQHGLAMPRETREQFRVGRSVGRDQMSPGDLVFFTTVAPGASHVGIVIGGDQFVHAPSERGVVRVEHLSAEYWNRRFVGARRAR